MKPVYTPSLEQFRELSREAGVVPVCREVLADLVTPVSAFLKIADNQSECFLFESAGGGERWGRYSILGAGCHTLVRAKDGEVEIRERGKSRKIQNRENPLSELEKILKECRPAKVSGLPRFWGGAVGFLGYDIVRTFERLPGEKPDLLGTDDFCFATTDVLVVFDNVTKKAQVIANAHLKDHPSPERAYTAALEKIDETVARLKSPLELPTPPAPPAGPLVVDSNLSREEFEQMVRRSKEYVQAGDIIQAVLSQRFSCAEKIPPFDLYRALRVLNPSPYLFFLRMGETTLAGSSPEVMVRLEDGEITLRPIAGTLRRGKTAEEDAALEKELLSDPKERAEHVMLVDLGRNDLGRVSETGTVRVDELMVVERYSHVMHIVSNVRGKLRPGKSAFDVVRATFPAGTLSGAPKIRAMEIIEELEPSRRGTYGGAVGYFGYDGNMDLAITIRTFLVQDGRISFQAGAGIVADSDPSKEYEETCNKAAALRRALEMAREGLEG
ncbi:MAG: anthranilate synthase component I [Bdellovibrionota bacterium]